MSAIELIRSVPNRDQMSAEQIRNYLYTSDPQRRTEKEASYSFAGLLEKFDGQAGVAEDILNAIKTAGFSNTAQTLCSQPLDFGRPSLIAELQLVANAFPDVFTNEVMDVLLSLGVDRRTPAQRRGETEELSLQEIETAIEAEATDTWFTAMAEVVRGKLHDGEVVSKVGVVALFAAEVE